MTYVRFESQADTRADRHQRLLSAVSGHPHLGQFTLVKERLSCPKKQTQTKEPIKPPAVSESTGSDSLPRVLACANSLRSSTKITISIVFNPASSVNWVRLREHQSRWVHFVLDSEAVIGAVAEQEAVLCSIGTGPARTTLREEGTRNIVEAMEKTGVQRLICQSSLGVGDSRANIPFFTKYIIVPVFLRHAFTDHERQEAVVKQSSLDWTIVHPPHLKDGPLTREYRHGFPITDKHIKAEIHVLTLQTLCSSN